MQLDHRATPALRVDAAAALARLHAAALGAGVGDGVEAFDEVAEAVLGTARVRGLVVGGLFEGREEVVGIAWMREDSAKITLEVLLAQVGVLEWPPVGQNKSATACQIDKPSILRASKRTHMAKGPSATTWSAGRPLPPMPASAVHSAVCIGSGAKASII